MHGADVRVMWACTVLICVGVCVHGVHVHMHSADVHVHRETH